MAQINIAEPSVQSLYVEIRVNGHNLASATGFVVQSPHGPVFVTNRHNVTGRDQNTDQPLRKDGLLPDELMIWHRRAGAISGITKQLEKLYNDNGDPLWREHPILGKAAEFVALPLTQIKNVQLYPYNPGNPGPNLAIGITDIISVVGFPFGIQAGPSLAIWATGFIASEPEVNYDNKPLMLIDSQTRPGQSGSAVVAYRQAGAIPMADKTVGISTAPQWRFLGIYSGRINDQSDLGLVWKVSAIQELTAFM